MTTQLKKQNAGPLTPSRSTRKTWLILSPIIVLAAACYFARVVGNPPGYYIDEASISYNAYTISRTGLDEGGAPWPLYFRAFGDYKNPVYIYALSAIYYFTGPSVAAARLLSATAGVLAAASLGFLGWRMTKKSAVALLVSLLALLTPWLFEISRVVLEVALYPLVLTVFLLGVQRASTRERWGWREIVYLASTLSLVTYTYSIGRLLGPLLALGLIFFFSGPRRMGILGTWVSYLITLVPVFIFNYRNPGALWGRFYVIAHFDRESTYYEIAWNLVKHFFGNLNPYQLFITGDPNPEQIAHIHGTPLLLGVAAILLLMGLWLVLSRYRHDAWWRFLLYGFVVSLVPASLTREYVHMLRLTPLLVFVIVLTIPAFEQLLEGLRMRRLALTVLVGLMMLQAAIFQWQFHSSASSPKRLRQFDNGYPEKIFAPAVAMSSRPIYLADALAIPGYIQAYWNAVLHDVPSSNFVRLPPDEPANDGALVISTEENCPRCVVLATSEFYTMYRAKGPALARLPLPESGYRAALSVPSPPAALQARESATVRVIVKNESTTPWLARERSGGRYQVTLANHWLDHEGRLITHDDGRAALLRELKPGEQVELDLVVNAPRTPGDYLLELDMLQEGVSWFGLKGSPTVRLPVRIQ